jgi:hypothetical protein
LLANGIALNITGRELRLRPVRLLRRNPVPLFWRLSRLRCRSHFAC